MKHLILVLLCLGLSLSLCAQNWAPINSTEQFNYSLNNSDVITHAIKVDSVHVNGQDSVFYFNRVFEECLDCETPDIDLTNFLQAGGTIWRDSAEQFLGLRVDRTGQDWIFHFENQESFTLVPNAELLDSWMFNSEQEAMVINKSYSDVLGVMDSVKLISIGNGNLIKLSKNHGILEFPELIGQDEYDLKGIQERDLGTVLPDFESIYDFEVGDVFLYKKYEKTRSGSFDSQNLNIHVFNWLEKKTVQEVTVYPDSVIVEFLVLRNDSNSHSQYSEILNENATPLSTENVYETEVYEEELTFYRSDFVSSNAPYQSSISSLLYDLEVFEYEVVENDRLIFSSGPFRFLGVENEGAYFNDFRNWDIGDIDIIIRANETDLYDYSIWFLWGGPGMNISSRSYSKGLGQMAFHMLEDSPGYNSGSWVKDGIFHEKRSELLAFEKQNGDSGGEMLTDSEVLAIDEIQNSTKLSIFPNPTKDILTIQSNYRIQSVSIYNLLGSEVLQSAASGLQMNLSVSDLPKGVYALNVNLENGEILVQQFIKE